MRKIDAKDLEFINDLISGDPALQNALVEALDRKLTRMRLMFVDAPPAQEIVNQGAGHEMIPEGQPLPKIDQLQGQGLIPPDLSPEERAIVEWFVARRGTLNRKRDCESQFHFATPNTFDVAWRTVKARGLILCEGSGPGARFRFYRG